MKKDVSTVNIVMFLFKISKHCVKKAM